MMPAPPMDTRTRLDRTAQVLATTAHSPSPDLHAMGLRLLDRELALLEYETNREEAADLEAFRRYMAAHPAPRSPTLLCEESRDRVRHIMRPLP
jgi:hypothetical protein